MKRNTMVCTAAGFLALLFGAACAKEQPKGPPPAHLDGLWHSLESGTDEGLGRYTASETWIILGEAYQYYAERNSETAMRWQDGTRGKIIITDKEITLHPQEAIRQMSDWEPVEKGGGANETYAYVLDGDELRLNDDRVFHKKAHRYEGDMFGSRNMEIRLVIGSIAQSGEVSGAYYQYYRNKKYGEPIGLAGRLEDGKLALYETGQNGANENQASMEFQDYTVFKDSIDGVWQDLREGKESNSYKLSLYLKLTD
ncbi:MAG: hypothetical protein LBD37_10480 [Treponema sp.]|nr:hypothetical protein [Treponema sp.]